MSVFQGGSAYNMANSISDGYIIPSELTFKKFHDSDIATFLLEADRLLREVRGSQVATDDVQGAQLRQRRMQRIQQSITIANAVRQRRR